MQVGGDAQYVTFGLGAEIFAAPVAQVREILDYRPPSRIPNAPPHLLGLTEVRGEGVPTIDVRVRLGMTPAETTPHTRIMVLDIPLQDRSLRLGLVTDRVFEVTSFSGMAIEGAPDIGSRWRSEYILGVVRRSNDFVLLIALDQLFGAHETPFADAAAAAHRAA